MFTRTLRVGMLTYYKMDLSKSIGYSWTITHKTGINSPFQMVQTTLKHLIKATKSTAKRQYIFFMSGEDYALVLDLINYISYFILHFFLQESSRSIAVSIRSTQEPMWKVDKRALQLDELNFFSSTRADQIRSIYNYFQEHGVVPDICVIVQLSKRAEHWTPTGDVCFSSWPLEG